MVKRRKENGSRTNGDANHTQANGQHGKRLIVHLPKSFVPGKTTVDVDVDDDTSLRLVIPKEAKPNDRLVLSPRAAKDDWSIKIVREEPTNDKVGKEDTYREVVITVPEGVEGGKTKLSVPLSNGKKLVVTAPPTAVAGDELAFQEQSDGEWTCRFRCRSASHDCRVSISDDAGGASGGAATGPCELKCKVPDDTVPGETHLRIPLGDGHVMALCPEDAAPGDMITILVRCDGSMIVTKDVEEEAAAEGTGLRKGARVETVTVTRFTTDPDKIFLDIVREAVAAGAIINPKVARGMAPPLNIPGMVATAPIQNKEELVRIPPTLFLSSRRCREMMPELYSAVQMLSVKLREREAEAFQAAALTILLHQAEARAAAAGAPGVPLSAAATAASKEDVAATQRVWALYADFLLCESFDEHPYWRHLDDPESLHSLFKPSYEAEYLAAMTTDVVAMHKCLRKYIPESIIGDKFELGMFLQARLAVLTRVFQLDDDCCMVPINDCFNHTSNQGANWSWDEKTGDMVLTAIRDHVPGEEIFISYGRRSNVLLFRTYGFTLPPEVEPDWTYFIRGTQAEDDVFTRFLPKELEGTSVHLEARFVQQSLVAALNGCKDRGHDAEDFLDQVCKFNLGRYESDPFLAEPIAALRRCREGGREQKHNWWDFMPAGERTLRQENAMRVKMSEYLCLLAHQEIVDLAAGRTTEDKCLEGAASVREVLLEGFKILKKGSRFELNTKDVPVLSGAAP